MVPRLLRVTNFAMLLSSGLAASGLPVLLQNVSAAFEVLTAEACPPCELLFRNLKHTGDSGKMVQDVKVQERGEPKSGTGLMFAWASGSLIRTCDYLQQMFGHESCWVDFTRHDDDANGKKMDRLADRRMIFQPALGVNGARCPCEAIERVSVIISRADKHTLPVKRSCAYSHSRGFDLANIQRKQDPDRSACTFADGTKISDSFDLWRCMHEADCQNTDDWLQMAIFRDPRPTIISTYYRLQVHNRMDLGNLEVFVGQQLPILCQWLSIRYFLFSGFLPRHSVEVWYDDALTDSLAWHYRWFDAIGLQLPSRAVEALAEAASANDLGFNNKYVDLHPGGAPRIGKSPRKFEDEVAPEVLEIVDEVLRVWLPPVLLEKLGVTP